MIEVYQHHDDGKTPGYWMAACTIDGVTYMVRSRHGAPQALARILVAAGVVPDQPMTVYSEGIEGFATYRSLHKAATRTIEESERRGPHSIRWRSFRLE